MNKKNVKLKTLSIDEKKFIVDYISNAMFSVEDGLCLYNPLFGEIAEINCFFMFCVDGVEFDSKENEDGTIDIIEDIYNSVSKDKELMDLFYNNYHYEMEQLKKYAIDVVEFNKNKYIHRDELLHEKLIQLADTQTSILAINNDVLSKQLEISNMESEQIKYLNEIMGYLTPEEAASLNKKIISGEYDSNKLADIILEKYKVVEFPDKK